MFPVKSFVLKLWIGGGEEKDCTCRDSKLQILIYEAYALPPTADALFLAHNNAFLSFDKGASNFRLW